MPGSDPRFRGRNCPHILPPMGSEETSFRDRFKQDFGLDLPIGAGSGSSRDDPMAILASDPHEAAITQMLVLRCLGIALERLWRVRSRNSMDGHGRNIERVAIETKSLTPTEIITEQVNHYFDLAAVTTGKGRMQDSGRPSNWPVGFVDAGSGTVFPYEIGWMHFDEAISNEPGYPGLGQTIHYAALGSKASIYVHDNNIANFPQSFDPVFLAPEFDAAASDVFQYNANVRSA
jgi:hypothetical protein